MNWEKNSGGGLDSGLADQVIAAAPTPHTGVRTPLALVEHEDRPGHFTLFFTAFEGQHRGTDFKHPPSVPHEQYEGMFATEFQLVLTTEAGEAETCYDQLQRAHGPPCEDKVRESEVFV